MIEFQESCDAVTFRVRVQARASRSEIAGEWQGALRVRLAAPPVDDRANEALRRLLAGRLNVSPGAVKITRGGHVRTKWIEIRGVTAEQVRAVMQPPSGRESPEPGS